MSPRKTVTTSKKESTSIKEKPFAPFFLIASFVLVIITASIYYKSLNNQLTTWDDDYYITNNVDIRSFHGDSIGVSVKKAFTSYVSGNYHPLTMLSLSIDYNKNQLDPKAYHMTSLVFHILNTLLVFCFIWLLSQQKWVAFITALLFAIHPMHVESVAWASERKDVLYSFFYLAALCTYIHYLKNERRKVLFYVFTLFLFALSVLSKAMAVSLPIVLFAIDYFFDRKITLKIILEKIPFLVFALIFGYVAILAQRSSNAVHVDYYNFSDRILFTCYGVSMYLWKLIAPFALSCYYNYPTKLNGVFPAVIYISPLVILGILFLIYRSMRIGKDVAFGFGFFIISIALVLQILPVGGAIIADRYSYLPYVGIFFIVARTINNLLENRSEKLSSLKIPSLALLALFAGMCCYLSFQRAKVWKDSISLWENAIANEKFDVAPLAFKSRATAYYMAGNYEKAKSDYDKYIEKTGDNADVFCDRGIVFYNLKRYDEAINDLNKAIQLNPQLLRAYHFLGLSNFNLKKYGEAIQVFDKAVQLKPDYPFAYYTLGLSNYYLGKYQQAIAAYTSAISYDTKYIEAYSNRGLAYFQLKKYEEALKDYGAAIQYNPQYANAFYNRALTYDQLKKYNEAIKDYSVMIQFLPAFPEAYYYRALDYFALQQFELALNDALKAKQLGYSIDPHFIDTLQNRSK